MSPGYGGWQAIDATPQEASSGFFQCGPAPLEAIRQGAVGLNHDVGFMLASVNADLMRWKQDNKSVFGFSKIYCNKYQLVTMHTIITILSLFLHQFEMIENDLKSAF